MKCKNCNFEIENSFKFCPNCSKSVYTTKRKILLIVIIFIIIMLLSIVFGVFYNLFSIISENSDRYQKEKENEPKPIAIEQLQKNINITYSEEFDELELIKEEEDSINRSPFSPLHIKTTYYKAYSDKNDLEFFVYQHKDTNKTGEYIYKDTYVDFLDRREILINSYNLINDYFNKNIINIELKHSLSEENISILSESQLYNSLSKFNNEDLEKLEMDFGETKDELSFYINKDLYELTKEDYINIKKISKKIHENNKYSDGNIDLIFNNNSKITINCNFNYIGVYEDINGDFDINLNKFLSNKNIII